MVIQCPQCQTRFKLPDDKMKPAGIKVRCAKCQHIFTAVPPAPEPEPEETAGEEDFDFGGFNMDQLDDRVIPSTPKQTKTIDDDSWADFSAPQEDESDSSNLSDLKTALSKDSDSNGDFSFDGDIFEDPQPKSVETETANAFDFSFDSDSDTRDQDSDFSTSALKEPAFDQGFDPFESPSVSVDNDDFAPPSPPRGLDEFEEFSFAEKSDDKGKSDFDLGDQPSDWNDKGFDSTEETAAEPRVPFESDAFGFDETKPAATPDEFDFGNENVGDAGDTEEKKPERFDFSEMSFDESAPAEQSLSLKMEAPREDPQPTVELPTVPPASAGEKPPGVKGPVRKPTAKPTRKSSRLLLTVLLVLLMGICGTAGYLFWTGETPDLNRLIQQYAGQQTQAQVPLQIGIANLNGRFINNREAGSIFVITGHATNNYPESRSAIAVKGILYDETGKPLLEQKAFCGNSISEKELETLPFAKIMEKTDNQFGDSLSNLNLVPGKTVPFSIVFRNVPQNISEFTVIPAESIAGTR